MAALKPVKPVRQVDKRRRVLACRVREVRAALGLTLRDVETATGVSNATLWHAEQGYEVTLSHALAIAAFFGLPIADLWQLAEKGKK